MANSTKSTLQEKLAQINLLLNPEKKLDSGTILRLQLEKDKIEKQLSKRAA